MRSHIILFLYLHYYKYTDINTNVSRIKKMLIKKKRLKRYYEVRSKLSNLFIIKVTSKLSINKQQIGKITEF